jgi:hypothetical protein
MAFPTPERGAEVKRLLEQALDLAPAERLAFLDRACSGDPELRAELERLLHATEPPGFMEQPHWRTRFPC